MSLPEQITIDKTKMNKNEQFVITINREVGTGGRTVGRKLAEKLCVKYLIIGSVLVIILK